MQLNFLSNLVTQAASSSASCQWLLRTHVSISWGSSRISRSCVCLDRVRDVRRRAVLVDWAVWEKLEHFSLSDLKLHPSFSKPQLTFWNYEEMSMLEFILQQYHLLYYHNYISEDFSCTLGSLNKSRVIVKGKLLTLRCDGRLLLAYPFRFFDCAQKNKLEHEKEINRPAKLYQVVQVHRSRVFASIAQPG